MLGEPEGHIYESDEVFKKRKGKRIQPGATATHDHSVSLDRVAYRRLQINHPNTKVIKSLSVASKETARMTDDVAVRLVDQENICNFAILAEELRTLKKELKDLEEEKVLLGDVEDEVLLTEDLRAGEGMLFRFGDAFIEMDDDRFGELVEDEKTRVGKRIQEVKERLDEIQSTMSKVKAELYSRFRDQIALEME